MKRLSKALKQGRNALRKLFGSFDPSERVIAFIGRQMIAHHELTAEEVRALALEVMHRRLKLEVSGYIMR